MQSKPLNIWGFLLGTVAVTGFFSFASLAGLWLTRAEFNPADGLQALLTVIPAPSPTASPLPTPVAALTPEASGIPTPPSVNISAGAYVQITGTGGEGLRLREEPGLGNTILTLASDAEIFEVLDGPRDADGYVWWYLSDPYNETRRGWAATNYLLVSQTP